MADEEILKLQQEISSADEEILKLQQEISSAEIALSSAEIALTAAERRKTELDSRARQLEAEKRKLRDAISKVGVVVVENREDVPAVKELVETYHVDCEFIPLTDEIKKEMRDAGLEIGVDKEKTLSKE